MNTVLVIIIGIILSVVLVGSILSGIIYDREYKYLKSGDIYFKVYDGRKSKFIINKVWIDDISGEKYVRLYDIDQRSFDVLSARDLINFYIKEY